MPENLITKLVVDPARIDEAKAYVRTMQADVHANEPGATFYNFYQQRDQPNVIWVMEEFADADALAFHSERQAWRAEDFGSFLIEEPIFLAVDNI